MEGVQTNYLMQNEFMQMCLHVFIYLFTPFSQGECILKIIFFVYIKNKEGSSMCFLNVCLSGAANQTKVRENSALRLWHN